MGAALNESQICYKDFPKMKEKFYQADKPNLEQKLQQESLQGRNIFRKSKNKIVTNGSKHLKGDNEPFLSSCVNAQQEHNIEPPSSKENYLFSKFEQLTPTEGTFVVAASRDHNPDLRKMKEKTLPKSVLIDLEVPAVSDSCYLHKKDGAAGTLDSTSLKVDKEGRFVNSQKICQGSTPQSLDSVNECRMTNNRMVYNGLLESHIKSMWL